MRANLEVICDGICDCYLDCILENYHKAFFRVFNENPTGALAVWKVLESWMLVSVLEILIHFMSPLSLVI